MEGMNGWVRDISGYVRRTGAPAEAADREKTADFKALMEDGSAQAVRAMALAMMEEVEVLDDYVGILASLDAERISHLRDMLWDEDQPERHAAALALVFAEEPVALDVLMEALEGGDATVRSQAMNVLTIKPGSRAEEAAFRHLHDEFPLVREYAVSIPGGSAREEYRGALQAALSDSWEGVQVKAAAALAKMGDVDALEALRRFANKSKEPNIRLEALAALARMGDESAVEVLYGLADGEEGSEEKTIARSKLRSLGLRPGPDRQI